MESHTASSTSAITTTKIAQPIAKSKRNHGIKSDEAEFGKITLSLPHKMTLNEGEEVLH